MADHSNTTTEAPGADPKVIWGGLAFAMATIVGLCILATLVWGPEVRAARADREAAALECRQQAAQQFQDGDISFAEFDEELAGCGGRSMR